MLFIFKLFLDSFFDSHQSRAPITPSSFQLPALGFSPFVIHIRLSGYTRPIPTLKRDLIASQATSGPTWPYLYYIPFNSFCKVGQLFLITHFTDFYPFFAAFFSLATPFARFYFSMAFIAPTSLFINGLFYHYFFHHSVNLLDFFILLERL